MPRRLSNGTSSSSTDDDQPVAAQPSHDLRPEIRSPRGLRQRPPRPRSDAEPVDRAPPRRPGRAADGRDRWWPRGSNPELARVATGTVALNASTCSGASCSSRRTPGGGLSVLPAVANGASARLRIAVRPSTASNSSPRAILAVNITQAQNRSSIHWPSVCGHAATVSPSASATRLSRCHNTTPYSGLAARSASLTNFRSTWRGGEPYRQIKEARFTHMLTAEGREQRPEPAGELTRLFEHRTPAHCPSTPAPGQDRSTSRPSRRRSSRRPARREYADRPPTPPPPPTTVSEAPPVYRVESNDRPRPDRRCQYRRSEVVTASGVQRAPLVTARSRSLTEPGGQEAGGAMITNPAPRFAD